MRDTDDVRALITRWVDAVQSRDLEGVLADHDSGIVMFDVPPPYDGIRGIADYRDSWPPFFEWLSQGATFQLVELEVTAGSDVAYAFGLLRCGTASEFQANPDNRLRLTMGLRKVDGHWSIAHEHHSFTMT